MIKQRMILYENLDKYYEYKHNDDIRYAKKYIRKKYSLRMKIIKQIKEEIKNMKFIMSIYRSIQRKGS
jgi:hypothetical protein